MALQQLRRAIIANDPIKVDDTHIIINDSTRLKRSDPTNFRSLHGRGDFYALDTTYFQYVFRDLVYNDYTQQCDKKRVQHVKLIDKKDVIAYLTGRIETCASVVEDSSQDADTKDADSGSSPSKKHSRSSALSSQSHLDKEGSSGTKGKDADGQSHSDRSYNRLKTRDQRSIDSVLMVKDRDFSVLRDKLSQHVTAAIKGKHQQGQKSTGNSVNANGNNAAKSFDPRGDRFTSNEDRFWRENLGSDFQDFNIDMRGSFKAKPATNSSSSQQQQQSSKSSASTPSVPKPAIQNRADLANTNSQNSSNSHRPRKEHPSQPIAKRPKILDPNKAIPIIIVPSSSSSLIFPGNAVNFFKYGHYTSIEEMRQKKLPMSQPARLTFDRQPGGNCSRARYQIVSHPNRLTKEEWDTQVVAVVITGQLWQFKQWPIYDGKPVDFFNKKIQGFFFHFDDTPPTGDVNLWTVKKLAFQRDLRHNDGQVLSQFWNILDAYISKKHLPLRY